MKKALCLLLASVLALSLAACSESSAQDSQAGGEKKRYQRGRRTN